MSDAFHFDINNAQRGSFTLVPVKCTLQAGQALGLTGDNGTGKTTLLDAVSGFLSFDGALLWNDIDIKPWPAWRRHRNVIGRLFQSSDGTVTGTALLTAACGSVGQALSDTQLKRLLEGIDLRQSLACLSFGQAKRLLLVATLARRTAVALLDEPLEGLDTDARDVTLEVIRARLAAGASMVLVAHRCDAIPKTLCGDWLRLTTDSAVYMRA